MGASAILATDGQKSTPEAPVDAQLRTSGSMLVVGIAKFLLAPTAPNDYLPLRFFPWRGSSGGRAGVS
jgi:hypothetical protein